MNVYEIFTKITMQNAVSGVLAAIIKDVAGLEGSIASLAKKLNSLNATSIAMGGIAGILGGAAAVDAVAKLAKHGENLLDQQDKLQRSGIAYNDVLKLQADYFDKIGRAIPTSNISGYLQTVQELRTVTGKGPEGLSKAQELALTSMKVDALLANSTGKESQGEYYKLLRAAEMKGIATTPEKRKEFIDLAFAYITAFGTKISASDYQSFARRGGAAFMNADIQKAMGPLSVLLADLGGQAAGTAAMTLQQLQVGAATMSQQQMKVFEAAGLLNESKVHKVKGSSRVMLDPGAIKGSIETVGDLPRWITEFIHPAFMKAAHGDHNLYESLLGKAMPNRNAQKLAQMFGDPGFLDQIAKDMGIKALVELIDQAYAHFVTRNPKGVREAFHSQYESMTEAIGAPMMQAAIPVITAVTDMFTTIGGFADAHKDAMNNIGWAVAGLGTAFTILGSVAVIFALASWIPGGIAVVAVTAIAGAIAGLTALNWELMNKYIHDFSDSVRNLGTTVWNWVPNALVELGKAIDKLTHIGFDWLAEKFNALGDAFMNLWNKLKGYLTPGSFEGSGFGSGGAMLQYASLGGGGLGGMGGGAGSLGGGSGPGIAARGTLKSNQNEAYAAAIAAGLNPTAAKALVANMSGESLANPANKHWDLRHFSQGIVQWDDARAAAINRQFGKFPKDMSVTEQVGAAIWEMKTKYKHVWAMLNSGASAQEMISSLVRDYEMPANKAAAIANRMRYFSGLNVDHSAGAMKPVAPYRRREQPAVFHHAFYLDGEPIRANVVRRLVKGMTHPTTAPYHDGSRHWTPPDSGLVGV